MFNILCRYKNLRTAKNFTVLLSTVSTLRLELKSAKKFYSTIMAVNPEAQSVLDYWYEPGKDLKSLFKVWFGGGKEQDEEIREKFGNLIEKARNQELKSWEDNAKSAHAHIILIDQFCRSIFRGSSKSFDCDHIALAIAKKFVAGDNISYKDLNYMERFFTFLPFEHDENIDDQHTSCRLFEEMVKDTEGTEWHQFAKNGLAFAEEHREVIQNCGRFPRRNKALGRENTPQEEELLKNYPYKF